MPTLQRGKYANGFALTEFRTQIYDILIQFLGFSFKLAKREREGKIGISPGFEAR